MPRRCTVHEAQGIKNKVRAHYYDSDNERHKYEIIGQVKEGMRGTPARHTCYKTQKGMCQAETEAANRKMIRGTKKKVDKVTESTNISIDSRKSQVNKESQPIAQGYFTSPEYLLALGAM